MMGGSPTTVMAKSALLDTSLHSLPTNKYKSKLEDIPEAQDQRQEEQQQHVQNQDENQADDVPMNSSVQVAVRIRPLLPFEQGNTSCVEVFPEEAQTSILKSESGETTETNSTFPTAWSSSESHQEQYRNNNSLSPTNSLSSYQSLQIGSDRVKHRKHTYTFDHVFPSSAPQIDIYETCVTPLVQSCIEGYNATVLAYGQTGSGKTYTILGERSGEIDDVEGTRSNDGIISRALKEIFNNLESLQYDIIKKESTRDEDSSFGDEMYVRRKINGFVGGTGSNNNIPSPFEYQVKIQLLEVYGEDVRDLLADVDGNTASDDCNDQTHIHTTKRRLHLARQASTSSLSTLSSGRSVNRSIISIRDGKAGEDAEVLGSRQLKVATAEEALQHLHDGLTKRIVGRTAMNANSSRSHAIFTVTIQQTRRQKSALNGKLDVEMKTSKIHIVDLSGSERVKRSMTVGRSLKEGIDINKGLLVLGNVISALGSTKRGSKAHIPYRDSKLTRILKGSLGGNHKTLMIACISPSSSDKSESNNTLRYANRAKKIKNKAKINVDPSSRVVNELKEQVTALAAQLLKERRIRENNHDYDEEIDDCPFSIEFLDKLVSGADSKPPWITKKSPQKVYPVAPTRPQSAPPASPPSNEENFSLDSWKVNDSEMKTMDKVPALRERNFGDTIMLEDPDIDKDITSYDFALRKLKESLWGNPGANRTSTPSLAEVRNLDELYDYLNKPKKLVLKPDVKSDNGQAESESVESNNHVNNVDKGQIGKLDETLARNESLLLGMRKCQRRYKMLMTEYMRELQKIQTQVDSYDEDKKKFENVIDLIEEGSKYSDSIAECLKDYEAKLRQMEKKRRDITVLTKVANQNDEEMQNLRLSIEEVRHQQDRTKQIIKSVADFIKVPRPTEDIESTAVQKDLHKHNLPAADSHESNQKEGNKQENIQLQELRQEIELLEQRLMEKEENSGFNAVFNSLTNDLGGHLMRELPTFMRGGREQTSKDYMQSRSPVPTTLNLYTSSEDFSALDSSSHAPAKRLSNQNVEAEVDINSMFGYQLRYGATGHASLTSKRQGRRKHRFIRQVNADSDQNFRCKERLPNNLNKEYLTDELDYTSDHSVDVKIAPMRKKQEYTYDLSEDVKVAPMRLKQDYVYDLGVGVKEITMQTTKRRNKKKSEKTSKREGKQVYCEEMFSGATHLVQLVRAIFGIKKDPVVRQW